MSEQSFSLEFTFEHNRQIDLMTGGTYMPPFTNKKVKINGNYSVTPVFDMTKVHKVPLLDETPQIPEREDNMSDRLFEELRDEAFRDALSNRRKNAAVRERLKAFEKSGTIKVTKDPFARKTAPDKAEPKTEPKPQGKGKPQNGKDEPSE
jgi:hypothetical protein